MPPPTPTNTRDLRGLGTDTFRPVVARLGADGRGRRRHAHDAYAGAPDAAKSLVAHAPGALVLKSSSFSSGPSVAEEDAPTEPASTAKGALQPL